MTNQKKCIDFYGEKLEVGDEVIPILEEALILGISGIISKIEYDEKYDNSYITITNEDGKVLLAGVDARCYTTEERYDERENEEYVYSLTFYNKNCWPMTAIPLTNKTDSNYEIPDEVCFASIDTEHLEEEKNCSSSLLCYRIYHFIIDDNVKLRYNEKGNYYDLFNLETNGWHIVDGDFKFFKNFEELQKYIKCVIEYFNNADLSYVNNDKEFSKNEEGKEFEKKLINYLKK